MKGLQRALLEFISRNPGWTLILAGLYLLSPIDLLPEAFLGPVGFLDDLIVVLLAVVPTVFKRRRRGS